MKMEKLVLPVLDVQELDIRLPPGADRELAVQGASLQLLPGQTLCVVGESGSGKSMIANAIMGLLPRPHVEPVAGRILFDGQDLLQLDEAQLRTLRGRRIGMVFQEPMTALNPVMRIGEQIAEVFDAHVKLSAAQKRQRILAALADVGLPEPEVLIDSYPFRLSGGQRQRVMIACALALEPALLICDEPTTALDVTTQAQILKLIRELQQRKGTAVLFITHDFGVVSEIADQVVVMQTGQVVEAGPAAAVLARPQHAYTRKLIAAIPNGQVRAPAAPLRVRTTLPPCAPSAPRRARPCARCTGAAPSATARSSPSPSAPTASCIIWCVPSSAPWSMRPTARSSRRPSRRCWPRATGGSQDRLCPRRGCISTACGTTAPSAI